MLSVGPLHTREVASARPFLRDPFTWGVAAAIALLLARGMGEVLPEPLTRVLGDRTDSIAAAWAHWWSAQRGEEGAVSLLVSFPHGEVGSLLVPLGTAAMRPVFLLAGAPLAHTLLCLVYLLFNAVMVGLLVTRLGAGARGGAVAALAFLGARPAFAHIGFGHTDGLASVWLLLAAWLAIPWVRGEHGPLRGVAIGLAMAAAVVENPYALPVVALGAPIVAVLRMLRPGGLLQVLGCAVAAVAPCVARLVAVGGGLGGNRFGAESVRILGMDLTSVSIDYAVHWHHYLFPWPRLVFDAPSHRVMDEGGVGYLGIATAVLAVYGAWRGGAGARVVLACGLGAALLAAGPWPLGEGGPPGPFFFLNALLAELLHPLTQPVRYTILVAFAAAVAAGIGFDRLARTVPPWAALVAPVAIFLDGAALGGPSINIPATPTARFGCFAGLDRGAVFLVFAEPQGPQKKGNTGQLLQMVHGLPGTHPGIGGWVQVPNSEGGFYGDSEALKRGLRGGGSLSALRPLAVRLAAEGIGWLVVDDAFRADVRGLATTACGGFHAVPMERLANPPMD